MDPSGVDYECRAQVLKRSHEALRTYGISPSTASESTAKLVVSSQEDCQFAQVTQLNPERVAEGSTCAPKVDVAYRCDAIADAAVLALHRAVKDLSVKRPPRSPAEYHRRLEHSAIALSLDYQGTFSVEQTRELRRAAEAEFRGVGMRIRSGGWSVKFTAMGAKNQRTISADLFSPGAGAKERLKTYVAPEVLGHNRLRLIAQDAARRLSERLRSLGLAEE